MAEIINPLILGGRVNVASLKLLLATVIFLGSTTIGYLYGKRYSLRLENLIYLQQCITILETEIVYGSTPLPEALSNVYRKGNIKVSFIFEDIKQDLLTNKREHIHNSFLSVEEKMYNQLHFKKEDVEIFLSLGRILGTSDRNDQEKNFIIILKQIELLILEARLESNKNEKLYRTLGIITGIGINILLV